MQKPELFIRSMLSKKQGAPPPVATITSSNAETSSRILRSFRRKPSSPSSAKICGIVLKYFSSRKVSKSIKFSFNSDASARPIVDFPLPINPIRNILIKSGKSHLSLKGEKEKRKKERVKR